MKIKIISSKNTDTLHPLTCNRKLSECQVGASTLLLELEKKLAPVKSAKNNLILSIYDNVCPSEGLVKILAKCAGETIIFSEKDNSNLAWTSKDGTLPKKPEWIPLDVKSFVIIYPWQLLSVNEEIVSGLKKSVINGEVRKGVNIEGKIILGKGSVLLPGVFIEGNAIIGENCKIGPNCYIRGSTSIGNNCHVGQAVEIKNSILMDKVSAGHLSYLGDSIIGFATNLGAGTITANLRHDGANQRSMVKGELIDTGRRKLGVIMGDNVHTGIHTSIYPGRKIWPEMSTRPGDIVMKDIQP